MKAEIIAIGTEILLGDVTDINSRYLARKCKDLGIGVYRFSVIGDNLPRLKELLTLASERSDLVIVGGGLGPTADDITKEALAEITGRSLVYDPSTKDKVEAFFAQSGRKPGKNNYQQASLPEGAEALKNPVGLACGVWLEHNDCTFVLLPGPPGELQETFEASVQPRLEKKEGKKLYERHYRFYGVGESDVDASLRSYMNADNPTLAPYAHDGEIELRLVARASDDAEADLLMEPVDAAIRRRFQEALYAVDLPNLQAAVGEKLEALNCTFSTAESCTGGLISKWITDIPGSSAYFLGGVCSYSNAAKEKLLEVPADTIASHGAVSEETALAMAKGARKAFGSDIALSTTGVAGPDGGSEEKPVGTIYIGIVAEDYENVMRLDLPTHYFNTRERIRVQGARQALFNTLKYLRSLEK